VSDIWLIAITVVLTIAAILSSLWAAWFFSRRKYELSYFVVKDFFLESLMTGSEQAVLTVDGRDYASPRFLEVLIKNTGKEEFVPEDFEQPVVFSLSDQAWRVVIAIASDENLQPEVLPARGDGSIPIGFKPLLLKPGEWFSMLAMIEYSGGDREVTVESRMRNIDGLKNSDESPDRQWLWIVAEVVLEVLPLPIGLRRMQRS